MPTPPDLLPPFSAELPLVAELDAMLQAAFEIQGAGIGCWAWNIQTGEIRVNDEWAAIVGYTLAELQPKTIATWHTLTHPEDLRRSERQIARYLNGDTESYECECRMRHKDGQWVWVLDRGKVLIHDMQGRPLWAFGAHTPITRLKRIEEERDVLLARFQRLAEHLPGFLYQYRLRPDGTSHFPFATDAIERFYGCWPQAVREDATPVLGVIHADDKQRVLESTRRSAEKLTVWEARFRVVHPSRGVIWLEGLATPERLNDGSTLWHGFLMDATASEAQRAALRLSSKVFSATQDGVLITDLNGRIIEVNEAFTRLTGYRADEVVGHTPAVLKSGRQGPDFYRMMWAELKLRGCWQGEIWNRRKDGAIYPELLSIDLVRDEQGQPECYIGVFRDITEIKQHRYELDRATYYDQLTGLPNRRLIDERLHVGMAHARRRGELLAVCYLDLDRFKQINESHDRDFGDALLRGIAERLSAALREHGTVGRVGGDEFLLLLTGLRSREKVLELVEYVLEQARLPFAMSGHKTLSLTASIGVALYPELDLSPDELVRYADQALYRAKARGRNCLVVFASEEDSSNRARAELLQGAERALAQDEFLLHFQPKLDLRTGRIWSLEALIRWQLPEGRLRAPGEFIDALSGSALELRVGDWVIDEALRQQRSWREQGLSLLVSVNVSAEHLLSDDFVDRLREALTRHGVLMRDLLVIEILETSRISDFARVCERLRACRELGVLFSLDDFGAGYSSLTYMRQLPVDALKIDRSFVINMLDSNPDLSIVRGIIGLGHAFGRTVIAEGAESTAHIERLGALGCDIAQGYGLARPMPAAQVVPWVQAWGDQHRSPFAAR